MSFEVRYTNNHVMGLVFGTGVAWNDGEDGKHTLNVTCFDDDKEVLSALAEAIKVNLWNPDTYYLVTRNEEGDGFYPIPKLFDDEPETEWVKLTKQLIKDLVAPNLSHAKV